MQNQFYKPYLQLARAFSLVVFTLSPLFIFAQDISGLYTGQLSNDSTGRKQHFELALSEYRGKITGYTYTTFIANDTFYYSIKRVEAERENGFLVVKDVKMENNNFPESPAKKVKQTAYFPLINDSTIDVARGRWETNRTKLYYSIGGKAELEKKEDDKQSNLLAHLAELGIESNIAFDSHKKVKYQDEPKDVAKNDKPEKAKSPGKEKDVIVPDPVPAVKEVASIKTEGKQATVIPGKKEQTAQPAIASVTVPAVADKELPNAETKPAIPVAAVPAKPQPPTIAVNDLPKPNKSAAIADPVLPAPVKESKTAGKTEPLIAKTETPVIVPAPTKPSPVVKKENPVTAQPVLSKPGVAVTKKEDKPVQPAVAKAAVPEAVSPAPAKPIVKTPEAVTPAPVVTVTALPAKKDTVPVLPAAVPVLATPTLKAVDLPVIVATRKNEVVQQLTFRNDSLIIALYDNGVVDGDSVSVFINGAPLLEKTMLKVSATKKTIYTSSYADSIQIVLFAENLGTIAPNTGLMTIRDGEEVYQVRFSADLKQNAAITLRRKR